jgi:hypothetical protein
MNFPQNLLQKACGLIKSTMAKDGKEPISIRAKKK